MDIANEHQKKMFAMQCTPPIVFDRSIEVKDMVHAPGVYEIRWSEWKDECARRISARLFHKERRKERWIVSARLMCKKGTRDETELYYKQTGFAVQAGQIADRCRDDGWTGLTEYIPDGLN